MYATVRECYSASVRPSVSLSLSLSLHPALQHADRQHLHIVVVVVVTENIPETLAGSFSLYSLPYPEAVVSFTRKEKDTHMRG